MVLDESNWVFSFFTPCHPETYGPEKQLFAFVVLKSAVMSRFLFDVFLYFFFFLSSSLFGPSSQRGNEAKGQLAQHQSHQSASVTNYY